MEPQRLQAGQGWQWIKQGYALFMKAPLLWIVILLICFFAVGGLSAVPVVGEPLASLLLPVVLAGLMAGCRALEHGDELELVHLFSGFQKHTAQLVTLGGIALVGQLLILGLMMMVGGAALVAILASGQPVENPEVVKQAMSGAGIAVLLGLVLFSVLMMAMQFAPMLVYFNNATPMEAMKLSLRAFLANIGPMLVYGVTFMLLAILASIPAMLGWLVLMPIVFTSLYACYRDIFPTTEEAKNARSKSDEPPQLGSEPSNRFTGMPGDNDGTEWHSILGVHPNSSIEHIHNAYKSLISQYHPDKVAMLGEELRVLAEKKAKEINAAYDEAMRLHSNESNKNQN